MENAKDPHKRRNSKWSFFRDNAHYLILFLVIILNFLGFFNLLPDEIDFFEKILSWTLLGLLLYHARLSEIFFGEEHHGIDVLLIISYFSFVLKDLAAFSMTAIEEGGSSLFLETYMFILDNVVIFTRATFMFGLSMLIVLSVYTALKVHFHVPSMMHIIHEEGNFDGSARKFLERFFLTFLVFIGFYLIVFNLISEWLAIAVDDPLLLLGIIFYIFMGRKLTMGTKIEKLGNMGERFYSNFISMFKSEKKILLALSGMLVLHILTDIANFMIPYIFGLSGGFYSGGFTGSHVPVPELLRTGIIQTGLLYEKIALVLGYAFNVFGMLFLMIGPAYIWYRLYRQEEFDVRAFVLFLFFMSVSFFLIEPAFSVQTMNVETHNLYGTDILSKEISFNIFAFAASLSVGVIAFILARSERIRKYLVMVGVAVIQLFFLKYIYHFFIGISGYYIDTIRGFVTAGDWFFTSTLGLFFLMTCAFYVGSSIVFLYETWS
ncbi:MAG: hypothetical protein ACLFPQ_04095 [Candidatus Woesearchaeota archaeon]